MTNELGNDQADSWCSRPEYLQTLLSDKPGVRQGADK